MRYYLSKRAFFFVVHIICNRYKYKENMNVEKRSSLFSLFCLVINVMVGMGCSGGEDSLFDDNLIKVRMIKRSML